MIYTKLVTVNVVCNFAVDKFFIWKHLEFQMLVSKFLDLIFKFLKFSNYHGWRHTLYQNYRAWQDIKLCNWKVFVWNNLGAKILDTRLQNVYKKI